ncbi:MULTISPECIES: hypothetical protein [Kitasatospora]|jgi:hypothetical protein|uniref:hypothetical protein n=1 Tax=Kitasatospora TaxID=2063 RepID=UPI0012FE9524|nr:MULTISPECIES: hypothetical protein [unclassified Kitasatospora]MDR3032771.1 hypothetical protein [Kitasatospora sp.]WAL71323.1 hypothetical protein OU787_07310 [Kitasatospora sp. YST-16]WNW37361.1 hypothetical protein RKE32_07260 [Streptomyces sp. Li-HN-5-13]
MARVHRAVLLRALAAGLALAAALAGSGGVERELARRGAERAVLCRQADQVCSPPAR